MADTALPRLELREFIPVRRLSFCTTPRSTGGKATYSGNRANVS
jgi:hypothetical protein